MSFNSPACKFAAIPSNAHSAVLPDPYPTTIPDSIKSIACSAAICLYCLNSLLTWSNPVNSYVLDQAIAINALSYQN